MQTIVLISIFTAGYLAIIFEKFLKVNKAAVSIVMAVACWAVFFLTDYPSIQNDLFHLNHHVASIAQIIFFLLGALTIVELIDTHKGFKVVTDAIQTTSKRKMLWLISAVTFFLSSILDNLTTTILIVSLLRKIIPDAKDRFLFCCLVVVAANAGGAWTPIGDVTTTMLWIDGQLSSWALMKALFIPSLVSLLVPLLYFTFKIKGRLSSPKINAQEKEEPGSRLVFGLGIAGLICVPLFKAWTGLPPFMGVLISLAILWLVTDGLHFPYEKRKHLQVPHILTKINLSGVLFFLGILLCVGALESAGVLRELAFKLSESISNLAVLSTLIGFASAIIDNIPLVAAAMGMYSLEQFSMDHALWQMIAYAAGTGGSLFIIGSSSGVALMGMEKIDFISYMKKMTLPVLAGYLLGMGVYLLFISAPLPQLLYPAQASLWNFLKPIQVEPIPTGIQGIDCIYCINLDIRKDKWEAMKNQFSQQNIYGHRMSAIDGWKELSKKQIKRMVAPSTVYLKRGQMGCLLSHLSVLQDAHKRKFNHILVLEDDVEFLHPIQKVVEYLSMLGSCDPDWDVLFLDEWKKEDYGVELPADRPHSQMSEVIRQPRQPIVPSRLSRIFYRHGLYAMIVSKKGMEKILKHYAAAPIALTIDLEINHIEGIRMYETSKNFIKVKLLTSDTHVNYTKKYNN